MQAGLTHPYGWLPAPLTFTSRPFDNIATFSTEMDIITDGATFVNSQLNHPYVSPTSHCTTHHATRTSPLCSLHLIHYTAPHANSLHRLLKLLFIVLVLIITAHLSLLHTAPGVVLYGTATLQSQWAGQA
jgi:hypothetical protein